MGIALDEAEILALFLETLLYGTLDISYLVKVASDTLLQAFLSFSFV